MLLAFQNFRLYRQVHSSSFIITKPTVSERKEVSRLMQDVFFKTDPSSMYSKVAEAPNICLAMQEMAIESLEQNLSFVAKDKEKERRIFGVAINGVRPTILKPNYMEQFLKQVKSKSEKTLLELWEFVSSMPPNADKYFDGAEKVFEVRYLVVDPEFRNRGIATALVNQSKKEAAAQGHKFIRIDCTSHFTARIASAAGMDCIFEINYQDYKNPSGEHVFQDVIFPHTKILVYAGKTS